MPSLDEMYVALNLARQAKDDEAVAEIKQDIAMAMAEDREARRKQVAESMTTGEKFLSGIGQGMTNVGLQAKEIASHIFPATKPPSPETMQEFEAASTPLMESGTAPKVGRFVGETAATLPVGFGAGKVLASGGRALAASGMPRLGAALLRPAGQAIGQGAAVGSVLAGPEHRGGGAVAGGLASALPVLGYKAAKAAVHGYKVSPGAELLRRYGAKNMTFKQLVPHKWLSQLEQAATSFPVGGPIVKASERAGYDSAVMATMRAARAPGTAPDLHLDDVTGNFKKLLDGFEEAYGRLRHYPVTPPSAKDLVKVVGDPTSLALVTERKTVAKFLRNQAMMMEKQAQAQGGRVPLGVVQQARSNIRTAIRKASKGGDPQRQMAELLEKADEVLTNTMEKQLVPYPQAGAYLKAVDAKYHDLKILETALWRQGDKITETFFNDLSIAARQMTPSRQSYAAGGGGIMRKLAAAGKEAFGTTEPLTGARVFLTVPGIATAPLSTSKTMVRLMTGQTAPQRGVQALSWALRRAAGPRATRLVGESGPTAAAQWGSKKVKRPGEREREEEW